jgi:aminoglycoside phosphotransferase family enzyme
MARTSDTGMHSFPETNVDAGPALSAKVEFLRQPRSYPDPVTVVTAVETHRSWVFMTDRYAYKLKKPGDYGFLDVRTVAARKYYCEEELRLNARLAGDVYLATVPLTVDRGGGMVLGGTGSIADWLVKMRRLPAERMLDTAIERRTLPPDKIRGVAQKLAHFYRAATPVEFAPGDYQAGIERDIRANLDELGRPLFGLREDLVRAPCHAQSRFLNMQPALFEQRAREGRIVEAHGDLRPEHVCLLEPEPVIIDCLEFSRALRTLDAAAELAFLAQECERLGAPGIGLVVFEVYGEITRDRPPAQLISFYKSHWACLRAKLCAWHLPDPLCRDPDKWSRLATDYLIRAGRYADDL